MNTCPNFRARALREVGRPLATAIYDSNFLKFTPNRPPGYTFSSPQPVKVEIAR
jgi:hypothetical protein